MGRALPSVRAAVRSADGLDPRGESKFGADLRPEESEAFERLDDLLCGTSFSAFGRAPTEPSVGGLLLATVLAEHGERNREPFVVGID